MLGIVGNILILSAFVACGLAGFAYFREAQFGEDEISWKQVGRGSWAVMTLLLIPTYAILVYLFLTHQFQYAVVYQNTSQEMPLLYQISATWASQEGSFLLWIVFTALVGLSLIRFTKGYEAPVMTVVAFCQFFLLSMIVGLQIGTLSIGSSPFVPLAEQFADAPVFQSNPGFIPPDGTGLNDLLQNPWMAIHPPTMFLGFSAMLVPFAFAIAALWKRKYTEWVRPALPWTILAVCMLGIGIMMGGYWAYVTLSFGGYWAWDPVENSSLVPWIVGVAGLHMMLIQRKSGYGHKAALFLSILAFMLVIYSTFLTRSSVLEDLSVHSFVDLGLTVQLLVWIGGMGLVGFGLFAYRYDELPTPEKEPNLLSREFLVFSGALVLTTIAAVVILGTSSPIIGHFFRDSPATVAIEFYNKWTLPLTIVLVFLVGAGQLFWWNKMGIEEVNRVLLKPVLLAVGATIAVMVLTPFVEYSIHFPGEVAEMDIAQAGFFDQISLFWEAYGLSLQLLLLLFGAFFAFFGNGAVLWKLGRTNPRMAGGAITHIGFAVMIIGILASSAFNNPIPNVQGVDGQEQSGQRDNFVVVKDETRTINGYEVTYRGSEDVELGRTEYVVEFVDPRGRSFTLRPESYFSEEMDQWIRHPEVKKYIEQDLFVAVTPREATGTEDSDNEISMARGDSTVIGQQEFSISFSHFESNVDPDQMAEASEISVRAVLEVTNLETGETELLSPVYRILENREVESTPEGVEDWDLSITFTGMDVDSGEAYLAIDGAQVEPEDWVVVEAYEKPLISLVWIGFIMLSIGFVVAGVRRAKDLSISMRRGSV